MVKLVTFVALVSFFSMVSCFGGSDDKFIKKYAMMKIYESCFGEEVVKMIRKEMKMACAKCAAMEGPSSSSSEGSSAVPEPSSNVVPANFDAEKLHQAILAYRPANPFSGASAGNFRPYQASNSFYNPAFYNPYQAGPLFYSGYPAQMPYNPYNVPMLGQQQFYSNRMSREMDIKSQLEALTSRMSGRVRNVTCVMQELGYLDENLEPNYQKISERIGNLPVGDELKRDMQEGVTFCQQFSQCVPEVKKDRSPLSRELIRPMFFFKCYKHKKLEACIMKDVHEKYAGVSDDDFDGEVELRRQGKARKLEQEEDLSASLYEFLYGSDSNVNFDEFF